MNSKIYINIDALNAIITNLKKLKNDLSKSFDSQKSLSNEIKSCWGGNTGDEISKELEDHSKKYEDYLKTLDEKIAFLENAIESYNKLENEGGNKIDNSSTMI